MTQNILLTGAAGRIGTAFRRHNGDQYAMRLVDIRAENIAEPGPHEVIQANLADLDVCHEVCMGMDTVIHLAANSSPRADFYGSLLDNNIKAMYNMFRAAKDQGCQRIIYASSIQAVDGYPLDVQATSESPIRPMNMYGAAKAFGEATAHYFAYVEGLSSIAIRIGAFRDMDVHADLGRPVDGRTLGAFVSARDLNQLIVQCVETPNIQYAVVQAVSDNRFKRLDITSTRELVGYQPQDDSFQVFNTGIEYRDDWYGQNDRKRPE